jgi:hypothetical protein
MSCTTVALRIEWCKARARVMRWAEEVELLEEEMQQAIAFCTWHENWWMDRSCQSNADWSVPLPRGHQEGLSVYGLYQASVQRQLREGFESLWRDIPKLLETHAQDSLHIDSCISAGPAVRGMP